MRQRAWTKHFGLFLRGLAWGALGFLWSAVYNEKMNCRHFSGYKPCELFHQCDHACPFFEEVTEAVVFIHLGALGSVVRSTALMKALRTKHPRAHITWVTDDLALPLLVGVPFVDEVSGLKPRDLLRLQARTWNYAYVVDKCLVAAGLAKLLRPQRLLGFTADSLGKIVPANSEAKELYSLGLDNELKFRGNHKTELQLIHEALALGVFCRDDYALPLTINEEQVRQERNQSWAAGGFVIGINVGCSGQIAHKKLSVQFQREIVASLARVPRVQVVLLGGGVEDERRAQQVGVGLPVVLSPMSLGLRDGLVSVAACDVVLSGDSLGMHMAISQNKFVIAWFGPTCAHEIDLFERGVKILSKASCAPCWKRSCDKEVMCYDQVPLPEVLGAINLGLEWCKEKDQQGPNKKSQTNFPESWSSKPPFLATSC